MFKDKFKNIVINKGYSGVLSTTSFLNRSVRLESLSMKLYLLGSVLLPKVRFSGANSLAGPNKIQPSEKPKEKKVPNLVCFTPFFSSSSS